MLKTRRQLIFMALGALALAGCTVKAKKSNVLETHGKNKKRSGLFTGKDGKMTIK